MIKDEFFPDTCFTEGRESGVEIREFRKRRSDG